MGVIKRYIPPQEVLHYKRYTTVNTVYREYIVDAYKRSYEEIYTILDIHI